MSCKCFNHRPDYTIDTIFDNFSLTEYLSSPIPIYPCNDSVFIYSSDIKRQKHKKKNTTPQTEDEIIQTINKNHFNIKIDTIELTYPNDSTEKFIECYKPIKYIGQGSFGLVIAVKKIKTEETFAVKIIQKSIFANENIWLNNEVAMLKTLYNKRTMKLHEVIETRQYLFLFMDLIEGGSLKEFIIERYVNCIEGKSKYFMTDKEAATIMKGILEGLHYMHKNSIAHRDLKPENIMFKDKNDLNSIIIGDFGIADDMTIHGLSNNGNKCGTLIYMAFEMLEGRPYDQLVDLWACGIIMYILESGGMHPLYVNGMDKDVYTKIVKKKKQWTFPSAFPNLARNFFMKLCKKEPFYRYHINTSLKHPWIERNIHNQKIPLTLIDVFEQDEKVKKFKTLLTCFIYFNIYKQYNKFSFIKHNHNNKSHYYFDLFDTPNKKGEGMPLLKLTRSCILKVKKSTPNLRKHSPRKVINFAPLPQIVKPIQALICPSSPITKVHFKDDNKKTRNENKKRNNSSIQTKLPLHKMNSSCNCILSKVDNMNGHVISKTKIDVYSIKKEMRNNTPGRFLLKHYQQEQPVVPIRKNKTRNFENSKSYKLIDIVINRSKTKKFYFQHNKQPVLLENILTDNN